jgi:uncharacterized protein (UPF0332 family)
VTDENRLSNARAEAALGDDALKAATALLQLGLFNDAVSRAYYAAFHHARALLLLRGLEPKTHEGVISLLALHFEQTGLLSSEALSVLARLQTFRSLADYDAGSRIAADRAADEVEAARGFIASTSKLLVDSSS